MKKYLIAILIFSIELMALTITTDTTLSEDTIYDENLTVDGAILNLNGHTLTVNGNFKTTSTYARLQMQKSDDKLIVNGDVTFGGASTYLDLTNGVIELTGNFYQIGTGTSSEYYLDTSSDYGADKYDDDNGYSFFPTDSHKVVFKGTSKQTITFDYAAGSRFNDIEILNNSVDGVAFNTRVHIDGELIRNDNYVSFLGIESWKLTEDLIVPNDLTVYDVLNLNGHTVTVEGNFKTTTWNGRLQMQKSDDKLIVNGDVTFGGASTYLDLTNGVIELTGNFYQIGTGTSSEYYLDTSSDYGADKYDDDNGYSFFPTDSHKVVFKGTSKQTITFDYAAGSRFNDIEILNEDVEFQQTVNATGTLYTTTTLYDTIYQGNTSLIYANYLDSSYYYFSIKAGMNLISIPTANNLDANDLQSIFGSNITTLWTYKDDIWNGFSALDEKLDTLSENNLSLVSSISYGEGIIVNSLTDQMLLFPKGDDYSLVDLYLLETLGTGWHLLGTNKAISLADLKALNSNIVSIWSYDTTQWLADAIEEDFIDNIEKREITKLENIESNSAFWVYVK